MSLTSQGGNRCAVRLVRDRIVGHNAFLPETLVENDSEDDIIVMVWHRDAEDSLILLGWERVETLISKVEAEQEYSGKKPEKLDHLATRPMNDLVDLGPNTAHMNQTLENPFQPGGSRHEGKTTTMGLKVS